MKTQIRIVAGTHRGRKISCVVTPELRPTPDMVREALFSILGNAVPNRIFVDIFSGTGIMALEALSRGASRALIIERDRHLANAIDNQLKAFAWQDRATLYRTDAYRWAANWDAPREPVNVFLSPPFPDLKERTEPFLEMIHCLQEKVAIESVITVQSERSAPLDDQAEFAAWERRSYSRNVLLLWQKEEVDAAAPVGGLET